MTRTDELLSHHTDLVGAQLRRSICFIVGLLATGVGFWARAPGVLLTALPPLIGAAVEQFLTIPAYEAEVRAARRRLEQLGD